MSGKPLSTQEPVADRKKPDTLRQALPLRSLALGAGYLALHLPGLGGALAQVPLLRQFTNGDLPAVLRETAAFSLLGFVIERQLGPRFWAACAWAFLGTGLAVQLLFPGFGGFGLSGVLDALLFIALWETWRRHGGLVLPALMFAASIGTGALALSGLVDPQDASCFIPAIGYACGALWAAFHACRDTLRELGLMTRLSWRLY